MMENAPVTQAAQHIHIHMDSLSYLGVPVDVISIAVTTLIGIAQLFAIFWGLRQMNRSSKERGQQLAQQAIDSERRHEQAMAALHALIKHMSPQPPQPSTG